MELITGMNVYVRNSVSTKNNHFSSPFFKINFYNRRTANIFIHQKPPQQAEKKQKKSCKGWSLECLCSKLTEYKNESESRDKCFYYFPVFIHSYFLSAHH